MYIRNSDVKKRLLQRGKTEFLKYGYKQASLRRICQEVCKIFLKHMII